MTAIDDGRRMCSIERTAAVHSRPSTREVLRTGRQLHRHPDDTRIQKSVLVEARRAKDVEHPVVLGEGVGDEPPDPALNRSRGEMLEQHRPETAPLVVIAHDESDLGIFLFRPGPRRRARGCRDGGSGRFPGAAVVAGDRHELALDDCHERQPVLVINRHVVCDLLVADALTRREETEVHRLC